MNKSFYLAILGMFILNGGVAQATENCNSLQTASIEKSSALPRSTAKPGKVDAKRDTGKKNTVEPPDTLSEQKAVMWLAKAAEQGDAKAQFNLGVMYDAGQIVAQNDVEALKWYRQAATQGDAKAQFNLGVMYSTGRGVAQDNLEAIRWYTKAAEQGHVGAQFNLGVLYDRDEGILQHDTDSFNQSDASLPAKADKMTQESEAVKWYQKAAEQGHALAQFNLGVMYSLGRGVPQDDAKAVQWYEKAAEQDDKDAQVNLGSLYAMGQGVTQSDAEAIKWYCKAAVKGHTDAQYNLGMMYSVRHGVPQDNEKAVATYCRTSQQKVAKIQEEDGDVVKPKKRELEITQNSEVSETPESVENSATQLEAKVHKSLPKPQKGKRPVIKGILERRQEIRETLF